ncbi:hypothetical protein NLJ89_g8796 [Agrocybe chaxingu]|uniref:Uncharacterized protein n=1 Tax=Agrocybe chaxingu TaxID=84603 RepID=A0A9W8MU57_9AGAR|nr:hypothetical protein NLJ89_g8796 [Agrocybe chaxingu]
MKKIEKWTGGVQGAMMEATGGWLTRDEENANWSIDELASPTTAVDETTGVETTTAPQGLHLGKLAVVPALK